MGAFSLTALLALGLSVDYVFGNFRVVNIEVGFVSVGTSDFVNVQTQGQRFKKPHVIMGTPHTGTKAINGGYQSCARLKNVKFNSDNKYTFDVKITQPNDTWCNYTWWTPTHQANQYLSFMVMEEGHFIISGGEFDISSRQLWGHCSYFFIRHSWFHRFYDGAVRPCSIAQAQTYDDARFMSFREEDGNNNANGVTIYVQLHNYNRKFHPKVGDCVTTHFGDSYDNNRFRQAYTMNKETVSIVGFHPAYAVNCLEGMAFESHEIDGITSDSRWLPYYWLYTKIPAVFGMVNSFTGGDDITLRSFNHSIIGMSVIVQEDQCDKQSTIHIQGEKMSFLVIGPNNLRVSPNNPYGKGDLKVWKNICCNISYYEEQDPTYIPNECQPKCVWEKTADSCRSDAGVVAGVNMYVSECKYACAQKKFKNGDCLAFSYLRTGVDPDNLEPLGTCTMYEDEPRLNVVSTCQSTDEYYYDCGTTNAPTVSPTINLGCAWLPVPSGSVQTGTVLAQPNGPETTNGASSLGDCENFCTLAEYIDAVYTAATGSCEVMFAGFSDIQPASSDDACKVRGAVAAAAGACFALNWIPIATDSTLGTCTLLAGFPTGTVSSPTPGAISVIFECQPTLSPTVAPTLPPTAPPTMLDTVPPGCKWAQEMTGTALTGQPLAVVDAKTTFDGCRQMCVLEMYQKLTTALVNNGASVMCSLDMGAFTYTTTGTMAECTAKETVAKSGDCVAYNFMPDGPNMETGTCSLLNGPPTGTVKMGTTVMAEQLICPKEGCKWYPNPVGTGLTGKPLAQYTTDSSDSCQLDCTLFKYINTRMTPVDAVTITCEIDMSTFVYTSTGSLADCKAKEASAKSGKCMAYNYMPGDTGMPGGCMLLDGTPTGTMMMNKVISSQMICPEPMCLNVMMADKFGDPAKNAKMFVYDSFGTYKTLQPNCEMNPIYGDYCFDCSQVKDGDSVTMVIHGYGVSFYPEIYWQVYNPMDGMVVTGDYSTTLKFVIRRVMTNGKMTCSLAVSKDSTNVVPNEAECDSCIIEQGNGNGEGCGVGGGGGGPDKGPAPKPGPKPAPPAPKPEPPKLEPGYGKYGPGYYPGYGKMSPEIPGAGKSSPGSGVGAGLGKPAPGASSSMGGSSASGGVGSDMIPSAVPTFAPSNSSVPTAVPVPNPTKSPAYDGNAMSNLPTDHNHHLEPFLSANVTWFMANGLGANYAIYDVTGLNVYYLGTLCGKDGDHDMCEFDLKPGDYVYRVDGLFSPDAAKLLWEYCDVTGGASTQINFTIDDDCECTVTEKVYLEDICEDKMGEYMEKYSVAETIVKLTGEFDLGGMKTTDLSNDDATAIRNAINKELMEAADNANGDGVVEMSKMSWAPAPVDGSRQLADGSKPMTRMSFEMKIAAERFGAKKADKNGLEVLSTNMKAYLSRSMSTGVFAAKLSNVARAQNAENLQSVDFARLVNLNVIHEMKLNEVVSGLANVLVVVGAMFGVIFGALVYRSVSKQAGYERVQRVEPRDVHTSSL